MLSYEVPQHFATAARGCPEINMGYQVVELSAPPALSQKGGEYGFLVGGCYFVPRREVDIYTEENKAVRFIETPLPHVEQLSAFDRFSGIPTDMIPKRLRLRVTNDLRHVLRKDHMIATRGQQEEYPPFQEKTQRDDVFYRLSAFPDDKRIGSDGSLVPGTYATTQTDYEKAVPSGLAAVGRYALPCRLPAMYVWRIHPPPRTVVAYGTVLANFGLAGGGVEALFPAGCPAGSVCPFSPLPRA